MLGLYLWVTIFFAISALFGGLQYYQYKVSSTSENHQGRFLRSRYFIDWIREILLLLLGCIIAYVLSTAKEDSKSKEDIIKTISSWQISISSEQKFNKDFINNEENFQVSKVNIKNGEDYFITNLLKNENISGEARSYLTEAGQETRRDYNELQKEQDTAKIRKYVEHINSMYDNIVYLLELEVEYQQGNITEFNIQERYKEYVNSKGPNDPEDVGVDSGYRILLRVRLDGDEDKSWKTSVNAQVGDIVEFLAEYKNVSGDTHTNVMIKNIPPKNLEIISGTTRLFNSNHPKGETLNADAIEAQPFNIGHYAPNSNAYISFKAKVINVSLQPGSNTLVNWTQCGVGNVTIQDYACVVLNYEGEMS